MASSDYFEVPVYDAWHHKLGHVVDVTESDKGIEIVIELDNPIAQIGVEVAEIFSLGSDEPIRTDVVVEP